MLKTEEKDIESKQDEGESIQNKIGPLRVHRMNWKLRNQKLTGWSSTNDEERTKNTEETFTELILEMSRKCYGSVLAWIFPFFLLLLTNFKWFMSYQGVELLKLSPLTPFYKKMGEVVAAQLAQASWVASTRSNPLSRIF